MLFGIIVFFVTIYIFYLHDSISKSNNKTASPDAGQNQKQRLTTTSKSEDNIGLINELSQLINLDTETKNLVIENSVYSKRLKTQFRSLIDENKDKNVKIEYTDRYHNISERTIRMVNIYYENSKVYLYAFCELRGDYRNFRLDRIINIKRPNQYQKPSVSTRIDEQNQKQVSYESNGSYTLLGEAQKIKHERQRAKIEKAIREGCNLKIYHEDVYAKSIEILIVKPLKIVLFGVSSEYLEIDCDTSPKNRISLYDIIHMSIV